MRILIVDGAKERRRELTVSLSELDNVVVQGAVADVRSALVALTDVMPDVLITSVTLPDGDGTILMERMRALTHMPAVIVLGSQSDEKRIQYLTAGADTYLDENDHAGLRAAVLGMRAVRPASGSVPMYDAQRMLGRITSGVVHDFNNYLHAMQTALDLMARNGLTPELLADGRASVEAMTRLNAMLLTYARGASPPAAPLQLGDVVKDALAVVRRIISPDITVDVDVRAELRSIHAVRPEIEQMAINLILNAADAMPNGGRLHIVVRQATSAAVLLEVSDSGIGFSQAVRSGPDGAGLGLTIVRNVVTHHAGALRFVARPSGGTTVAVMLPTTPALGLA